MSNRPQRILFVCLGNICRSPAAEGVMQRIVNDRRLGDRLHIDSAGTSSFHIGEPADKRMRAAAKRRGIALTSRARMVHRRDFKEFDLVVAMDGKNYQELMSYPEAVEGQVRMLSDFLSDDWPKDVPDPYYGGDEGFDQVLDMLEAACPNLLAELKL
jgi:protein-tyrosine phosphatase